MNVPDGGPSSHYFLSQRLKLHFVDWGNANADPLILIHGGADHCRNWDWVARALRDQWHVIALDLRGHGDSEHVNAGGYTMYDYVYDLAQLIDHKQFKQVSIVGHSLGGNIAIRYTGLFPERVRKLVAIEGLGPSPTILAERFSKSAADRTRTWITSECALSGRVARRYPSIQDACKRMQEKHSQLTEDQVNHLTTFGVRKNADGTYSWKFDNYVHVTPPSDMTIEEIQTLWGAITCPTLLAYGEKSWASNPLSDGRAAYFKNAKVVTFPDAGHWLHHDQLDSFLTTLQQFLEK